MSEDMVDIARGDHIFRAQKKIALFSTLGCLAAIFVNITVFFTHAYPTPTLLFNLIALSLFTGILIITYFVNKPICRFIHIFLFVINGILILLTGDKFLILGIMFFFNALLLSYVYGILKIRTWRINTAILVAIIVISLIGSLKIFGAGRFYNLTNMAIYCLFTAFSIYLGVCAVKLELVASAKPVQDSQLHFRMGMNVKALLHNIRFSGILGNLDLIKQWAIDNKANVILPYIQTAIRICNEKDDMVRTLLSAIDGNRIKTRVPTDLHKLLNTVILITKIDGKVFDMVKIKADFYKEDIFVNVIPFEFANVLQNIVDNAAEAMIGFNPVDPDAPFEESKKRVRNKLVIKTGLTDDGRVEITIMDNGPGFKNAPKDSVVNIFSIHTSKPAGGFGLYFVDLFLPKNGGTWKIYNNRRRGAKVVIWMEKCEPVKKAEPDNPVRNEGKPTKSGKTDTK